MAVVFRSYYSCRVHLHVFDHFSNCIKHKVKCFIRYQHTAQFDQTKKCKKSKIRLAPYIDL